MEKGVSILTNTKVTRLLRDPADGAISGVEAVTAVNGQYGTSEKVLDPLKADVYVLAVVRKLALNA